MRIGGIASGFDTESMIKELMNAERIRMNNFRRQEQTYLWRQEAYNTTSKSMANFILNSRKNFGLTQITAFGTVRESSLNSLEWVKRALSSNEALVSAKAKADAMNGSHKVEVTQLAENASITSINLNGTLLDENQQFKADGEIEIETAKGKTTIQVKAGMKISTFVSALNNAKDGDNSLGIRAAFDKDLGKLIITTRETGADQFIRINQQAPNSLIGKDIEINTFNMNAGLLDGDNKFVGDHEFKITVGSETVNMQIPDGMPMNMLVSVLKDMGVAAEFDQATGELTVTGEPGQPISITDQDGNSMVNLISQNTEKDGILNLDGTFKADGSIQVQIDGDKHTIDVHAGDSINDLITQLSALGVDTRYENEQLIIENQNGRFISVSADGRSMTSGAMQALGSYDEGKDSVIKFNGDEVQKSSNNFTIYGIELDLKAAEVGKEVTINVSTDVDGIFNKISEFVDSYNKLVDEINGKLGEKKYRDYQPLTPEEKEAMSEKEVELWEEKAKSGLLKSNESLTRTLQSIRTSLYQKVEGATGSYDLITQVGITTGNYKDGGKLVIDEDKLKDAISNDPEGVMNLFFKVPETTELGEARTKESGLVQRVYDGFVTGMKDIIRQSGTGEDANLFRDVQSNILIDFVSEQSSISLIDKDLLSLSQRILREEQVLQQKENRYWQKFTAMEKALSQMNQQSNWLMSQLGLGG